MPSQRHSSLTTDPRSTQAEGQSSASSRRDSSNSFNQERLKGRLDASGGRAPKKELTGALSAGFGQDLSGLKIHDDAAAADVADSANAKAVASGSEVFLGEGVQADTSDDVFMHEVGHVVQAQQGGLSGAPSASDDQSANRVPAERQATSLAGSASAQIGSPTPAAPGAAPARGRAAALPAGSTPVMRDGNPSPPPTVSFDTRVRNPFTFGEFVALPANLATYNDGSQHASSLSDFVLRVISNTAEDHPLYQRLNDRMADLEDLAADWAGDAATFDTTGQARLGRVVASASTLLTDFTTALDGMAFDLAWDFPVLGIHRAGKVRVQTEGALRTFALSIPAALAKYTEAVQNNPNSPFAATLPDTIARWQDTADGLTGPASRFVTTTAFQAVSPALINQTTTLLTAMNTHGMRVINCQLPAAFQLTQKSWDVSTYEDGEIFISDISSELFFRDSDLFPSAAGAPPHRMAQTYTDLRSNWDAFHHSFMGWGQAAGWTSTLSDMDYEALTTERDELLRVLGTVMRAFAVDRRQMAAALGRAQSQAQQAARHLADMQRSMFLGGDSEDLPFVMTMVDSAGTFIEAVQTAHESVGGAAFVELHGLNVVGVLAKAITWGNVIHDWSSATPLTRGTPMEGMSTLQNLLAVSNAVNSTFINPLLIVTSYVGPMVAAISQMMGKLQTQLIAENDIWVSLGYDPLYINAEPGGSAMWDYMCDVMVAHGANAIVAPTGGVYDYFEEFRDEFDELGEGESVPTDGGILGTGIDKDVDPQAFKSWIFSHRDQVWRSLYGSREVPEHHH